MFSWILGYKPEEDPKEENAKKIEEEEDKKLQIEIPPPPPLVRQIGYHKAKTDDVIYWKNYEDELKKIREELKNIKIESDKRWNDRLSPVLQTRSVRKKRKKKSESASVNIKK